MVLGFLLAPLRSRKNAPVSSVLRVSGGKKQHHFLSLLEFLPNASSHSHEKNGTLACSVRRKKAGHIVVIKSQAGSAQSLGLGRKIQLAAQNAGFKLHRAVSAIPEALQNRPQVCQEKYVYGGFGGQRLV